MEERRDNRDGEERWREKKSRTKTSEGRLGKGYLVVPSFYDKRKGKQGQFRYFEIF
uniref:Uncharacterized protein n=1 Tax=Nelumbo nucifera TaxID=4432 RepID=A0A822YM11_NELNU|nr:TPA_asm: hypothetical protein HUJ06_009229 [Nelumbo nucifera]